MAGEVMVQCDRATKDFVSGTQVVHAVRAVSFEIRKGEFTSVVGPSGSGKSTLLNLIGCLDVPTSGEVRVDGVAVSALSDAERSRIRNEKIGFIFQNFQLIPVLTAYENVEFALQIQGRWSAAERRQKVTAMLEAVGLQEAQRRRPGELSGGQQQRVAIARALVKGPVLVLADEPTANLDSATTEDIVKLMLSLNTQQGATFLFSTHDVRVTKYARRQLALRDGQLDGQGGAP